MLKIKWTDRVTNGEVFRRAKEERLLLKIKKKNRRHSWIGHTVRRKECVVNILEGAMFGKIKAVGRPGLQYLKQVARNTAADSNEKIGLQELQMESGQPIKKKN